MLSDENPAEQDKSTNRRVSMHLLVLSAFRRVFSRISIAQTIGSQCTFWCSVLSDYRTVQICGRRDKSQCTFWCSVLSDGNHAARIQLNKCLNAPFGAQCFPTPQSSSPHETPSASQCTFWCSVLSDGSRMLETCNAWEVSMHLLVLSAFRRTKALRP